MRDRLTEFLPLLLVGLVLLAFQFTRSNGADLPLPDFASLAFGEATARPTPTPIAVSTQTPRRQTASAPPPDGAGCTGTRPRFQGGIATLKSTLGATMGDPIECERVVSADGDTQQQTTTGLAYYRKRLNAAAFTTGWDHWGLVERGVVHWASDAVDPPPDAALLR